MQWKMAEILETALKTGASDIHLAPFAPPTLRIHGEMRPLDAPPLQPEDTIALMQEITPVEDQPRLQEEGSLDFGFAYGEKARFRVNVLMSKGNIGLVLRVISNTLLTLEQIGFPNKIREILMRPRGLVLVTGPTGSGKSTTLASMIDLINQERHDHIITIEDPIEFYHTHKNCIVTQREVHHDVPSFAEAIRRALREDPDIILVGEMRDLETIGAALTAAETGHLVFGTLHTTGAADTVDRIIDSFPTNQQPQIRAQLAACLICVISQVLLKRKDGSGRVAAFEIMVTTFAVQALIRDGQTFRITSEIQTGRKYGMQTLDDHLYDLFMAGVINFDELREKCKDAGALIQRIQSSR